MPARLRKVLFWIHLIGGVTLALPVFVLCVTGVLMTYERQTETWIDHRDLESHGRSAAAPALELDRLIGVIREARGVDAISMTVFADRAKPLQVQLDGKPPSVLYLDAASGVILGQPSRKIRRVFQEIRAWHLALAVSGPSHNLFRAAINATNLAALFLALFGILLWMPQHWTRRHLRPIMMFRSGLVGRARDFNWHNTIGIWSVLPLLIIVWTGAALSYRWPRQFTDRVVDAANAQLFEARGAAGAAFVETASDRAPADAPRISLDALLERAKTQAPGWKAITMLLPGPGSSRVYFTIDMLGDGIRKVSALGLDRAGRVVSFVPAASGISSTTFTRYGHTGEAWGVAGQTVAGAASLGGAFLAWTGVALSLRRLSSWLRR